ncbi:MAG: RHS repeat-associated core domain-containing protein, partial [Bacteroidota bacterium]
IFFDQEMNYVRAGFLQITTAAQGISVHETISLNDIVADQEGYILAYLSNENAEEVAIHWDDFRVYHGKTNVVQAQAYYPGGATFNEHQRTASVENNWKFQSKEWLPELRVYDFGPRGWDPLTWRTNAQDILADQFPDQSSYSLFRNNPIRYTDPDGRAPIDPNCPNCVADDQVLSLLYLNFIAARKNVANTIAGFIKAGPMVPFIIRNEFSVMTGEDGVPFLHESGPRITDKLSATVFGAIDGASIYPGGGPTGLLAKTGSRATLGSTSKQALRYFTRDGELGGVVNLFEGNSKKGLQHILERHSADDFLDKAKGDLFPSGTTNEQIFDAIGEVFNKGTRVSNPSKSVQTFEKKIKLNDQTDNYRLVIDQKNEEVVTFFRVGGTE